MSRLRWTPPRPEDDDDWIGLLAAIEARDRRGEVYVAADVADERASLWAQPGTDAVFVWDRHELVAFGWLKVQPGRPEPHRIACWGGVRPSHRRLGIGADLLAWQVQRAREVAAELDRSVPVNLEAEALADQHDLVRLLGRAGFTEVRRFLELMRPLGGAEEPLVATDLTVRRWRPGDDDPTRLAHLEAFSTHWGRQPRTRDEWHQWHTGHRHFRPDVSAVVVDDHDMVVAYALCAAYPHDWTSVPPEIWLTTVGTRPAWRRQGLARSVVTAAIQAAAAADDGFERAMLGVDAGNATGALELYRSLGFTEVRTSITFRRAP